LAIPGGSIAVRWGSFLISAAFAACVFLLVSPLPAQAVPITEPIVFDFEDGLQGWELHGAATRVQTQLLGGEWAIFGDGFAGAPDGIPVLDWGTFISLPLTELIGVGSISVEAVFIGGDANGLTREQHIHIPQDITIGNLDSFEPEDPGNSKVWVADVFPPTMLTDGGIGIIWGRLSSSSSGVEIEPVVAFIDNITFYAIPEPTPVALVALSLVGLVVLRRRRCER
jgi:hypothetical protein